MRAKIKNEWKVWKIALIILNSHRHGKRKKTHLRRFWRKFGGLFDRHEIELQSPPHSNNKKETTQGFRLTILSLNFCDEKMCDKTFLYHHREKKSRKKSKKELSPFLLFFLLWSMEKWLRKIREIREADILKQFQFWSQKYCYAFHPILHFFIKKLKRMNIQEKKRYIWCRIITFSRLKSDAFFMSIIISDQPIAHFKIEVNLKLTITNIRPSKLELNFLHTFPQSKVDPCSITTLSNSILHIYLKSGNRN